MKQFKLDISSLSEKPYFLPVVGIASFLLINGALFGFLWFSNREVPETEGEVAGTSDDTASPTPTATATAKAESSDEPSPKPKTSPTPRSTSKPTTAPTTEPTATPTEEPKPKYDKEDVRINAPENNKTYDTNSIEVKMEVLANSEVTSLDVIINGEKKHTFSETSYNKTFELSDGDYTLKGVATLKDGETLSSGELKFTVKTKEEASPTPEATEQPSPTPDTES